MGFKTGFCVSLWVTRGKEMYFSGKHVDWLWCGVICRGGKNHPRGKYCRTNNSVLFFDAISGGVKVINILVILILMARKWHEKFVFSGVSRSGVVQTGNDRTWSSVLVASSGLLEFPCPLRPVLCFVYKHSKTSPVVFCSMQSAQ